MAVHVVLQDEQRGFSVSVDPDGDELVCFCEWPGGEARVRLFSWEPECHLPPPPDMIEWLMAHEEALLDALDQGDSRGRLTADREVLQDEQRGFRASVNPDGPELVCVCKWPGGQAKVYLLTWESVCHPPPPGELMEWLKAHEKKLLDALDQGDS